MTRARSTGRLLVADPVGATLGERPAFDNADRCPDKERFHTPHPLGYLEHSTWAARMSECHTQHQCLTCGFWATWKDIDGQIVLDPPSVVLPPLRRRA